MLRGLAFIPEEDVIPVYEEILALHATQTVEERHFGTLVIHM